MKFLSTLSRSLKNTSLVLAILFGGFLNSSQAAPATYEGAQTMYSNSKLAPSDMRSGQWYGACYPNPKPNGIAAPFLGTLGYTNAMIFQFIPFTAKVIRRYSNPDYWANSSGYTIAIATGLPSRSKKATAANGKVISPEVHQDEKGIYTAYDATTKSYCVFDYLAVRPKNAYYKPVTQ